jgi:hypothetical protein
MAGQSISIDGDVLWAGIRRVSSRTKEPILCILKGKDLTFVAPGGLRLVVLWQFELTRKLTDSVVFTIPPMIASFLTTEAIRDTIKIEVDDEDMVTVVTQDRWGHYELHWHSDVSAFAAPEEFNRLLAKPPHLMEVSYLHLSDTVHEAVAKLVSMESDRQIHPTKLAILVDIGRPTLKIDGQEIEISARNQYYFDPRLIIRALELIKSDTVQVGFTQVADPKRAFLSILAKQDGYIIHCALLSIGMDTQRLYPLPPKIH